MIPYSPPVSDMRFVLEDVADLASIASLPGYEVATPDTVAAVLDQAAELARDVLAPLNDSGDREGARLENGIVRTPVGFRDAYQAFVTAAGAVCHVPRTTADRACHSLCLPRSPRCGVPRISASRCAPC